MCDGCPNWLCKIRWHQSKSVAYTLSLAIPYTQLSKTFSKWNIYNFICRVVQFFRFQIISGHPKTRVTIFSVIAVEAEKKWFRRDVTRKFNILTGLPAADWLTIESCCAVLTIGRLITPKDFGFFRTCCISSTHYLFRDVKQLLK